MGCMFIKLKIKRMSVKRKIIDKKDKVKLFQYFPNQHYLLWHLMCYRIVEIFIS